MQFLCRSRTEKSEFSGIFRFHSDFPRTYTHYRTFPSHARFFLSSAHSSRVDRSFDVCEFEDDTAPLHGLVHSDAFKVLFREYCTHTHTRTHSPHTIVHVQTRGSLRAHLCSDAFKALFHEYCTHTHSTHTHTHRRTMMRAWSSSLSTAHTARHTRSK